MKFLFAIFAVISLLPQLAGALPVDQFGLLPVVQEGRVKPLSVFAREELRLISGESRWDDKSATEWLAAMLFAPDAMNEQRVIRVESQAVRESLSLPGHPRDLYPLKELQEAMRPFAPQIVESLLAVQAGRPVTALQKELTELYSRLRHFQELQDSLHMFRALPGEDARSYRELTESDVEKLDDGTRLLLAQMEERGRQNNLLKVIPSPWPGDEDWFSPWALQFNGKAGPQTEAMLAEWWELSQAWRSHDQPRWDKAQKALRAQLEGRYHPLRLQLEEWYYRLSPLTLAVLSYGVFLLFSVIARRPQASVAFQSCVKRPGLLRLRLAMTMYVGALALHGGALLVRMLILGRPPVSNLYESVLFVSFILALMGLVQNKGWLRQAAAAVSAALLLLSQTLLSGQEQLPVVMAVLNTDFWLGTHVICITAGYAVSVLVSLMAHYALWRSPEPIPGRLRLLTLLALLLTAVGTLLGGIWADQSWGRFWGWDPKENGALLIVLWLTWLLHGRIAGQISERWYLAGLCFTSVMVALAWFGVNLLSVGLHSYGFTEGTAWGLLGFIGLEALAVVLLVFNARRREAAHAA